MEGIVMDSGDKRAFVPPYNVAWATFLATLEKVANDLPNRVDRHYLDNQSGSVQSYLISAFKGFGLIHEDLTVDESLKKMADPEARKATIAQLLRRFYPKAVELGTTNATEGELNEAFAEMFPTVTGESRVKAIRFYLFAAEYADLPRSPFWKTAKAGTSRKGRTSRKGKASAATPAGTPAPAATTTGETKKIDFGDAGTVTITVDVKWLDLPADTMVDLRKAVDAFEKLSASAGDSDDEEAGL
jgi:hypothetical protein